MKFKSDKNKSIKKNIGKKKNNVIVENDSNNIEIIVGNESALEITEVGDCMNPLRPQKNIKKNIVIPKSSSKKDSK